ncbi:hypothetical protein ACTQ50_01040 [Blautia sp. Sow4_E7]
MRKVYFYIAYGKEEKWKKNSLASQITFVFNLILTALTIGENISD